MIVRMVPKMIQPNKRIASVSMADAPGWKVQIKSSKRSAISQPIVVDNCDAKRALVDDNFSYCDRQADSAIGFFNFAIFRFSDFPISRFALISSAATHDRSLGETRLSLCSLPDNSTLKIGCCFAPSSRPINSSTQPTPIS